MGGQRPWGDDWHIRAQCAKRIVEPAAFGQKMVELRTHPEIGVG